MKRQHLLWSAIDTTGLDPAQDAILEMYLRVTDMQGHERLSVFPSEREQCYHSGLPANLPPLARLRLNQPEILRRHTRSGLMDDWQNPHKQFIDLDAEVDDCLAQLDGEVWLAGYAPRFTYEFMRQHTPRAHARLHFQQMDLTSCEHFMNAGFDMSMYDRPFASRVRARVDAAVEQYRFYMALMGQLVPR